LIEIIYTCRLLQSFSPSLARLLSYGSNINLISKTKSFKLKKTSIGTQTSPPPPIRTVSPTALTTSLHTLVNKFPPPDAFANLRLTISAVLDESMVRNCLLRSRKNRDITGKMTKRMINVVIEIFEGERY
jgi:hypothetical protein